LIYVLKYDLKKLMFIKYERYNLHLVNKLNVIYFWCVEILSIANYEFKLLILIDFFLKMAIFCQAIVPADKIFVIPEKRQARKP